MSDLPVPSGDSPDPGVDLAGIGGRSVQVPLAVAAPVNAMVRCLEFVFFYDECGRLGVVHELAFIFKQRCTQLLACGRTHSLD